MTIKIINACIFNTVDYEIKWQIYIVTNSLVEEDLLPAEQLVVIPFSNN